MNFLKTLSNAAEKNRLTLLAEEILNNPNRITELLQIIYTDKKGISWKASYVLDLLCDKDFSFFEKNKRQLIDFLLKTKDTSIHRHLSKLCSKTKIPEKQQGKILNFCTENIISKKTKVAVKVHCLEIFYNISTEKKELKQELELIINQTINNNTTAFENRALKILKKLKK